MKLTLLTAALTLSTILLAQKNTPQDYVFKYYSTAQQEMQRSGVPAAITLAQGILESESGNGELALKSNNHFGIKCKTTWQGDKAYHNDDAKGECFRKYSSVAESYVDHSNFLKNNNRYSFLFDLDPQDYKAWAKGLKQAGYATNHAYATLLISIIERYNLQQFNDVAYTPVIKVTTQDAFNQPNAPVKVAEPLETTQELPATQVTYNKIMYINETKCIVAQANTSLLAIATLHNINLNKLLDFNDYTSTSSDILIQDAIIYLQRKRKTGALPTHVVSPKETLHSIAQAEGIRLESLLNYNNLQHWNIVPTGTSLLLQPTPATKSK